MVEIDFELAKSLPYAIANRAKFLPIRREDLGVRVLLTVDTDSYVFDDYRMRLGVPVLPERVSAEQFKTVIGKVYEGGEVAVESVLEGLSLADLAEELAEKTDLLDAADDAPIIQLVNNIIVQAKHDRASDIHIEPFENDVVVRFRVDGILHEVLRPAKPVQLPLMSRIKVMAGLNIAEKRLPQDGSMSVQIAGRDIDVRVSSLPTSHGERLVLRLLEKDQRQTSLNELGMRDDQVAWFRERLATPYGILLVTGPTGSGKSTTLYAALSELNSPEKNIITIEDPIEYTLPGIGQIQVNSKIGLDFASGLRSILRQDPDIIMLGEIRDLETAEIAIQSSLTGHLVFSTLHTNDAVGAVVRLIDLGVESFLLGSSLVGVVAQRLVRRLCEHCRVPVEPPRHLLRSAPLSSSELAAAQFYAPGGCEHCMATGYRGRIAIFELLTISDRVREKIDTRASAQQLRRCAKNEGMETLIYSGWHTAASGLTSIDEVLRVIHVAEREGVEAGGAVE